MGIISATLARLALLYVVLQLILKVFDRGMKGRDPYIKEVVLPDGITSRLSAQPKMIEMLKAIVGDGVPDEIIQNADDCAFDDDDGGGVRELHLECSDEALVAYHNERGFQPKDLYAMCQVGESSKLAGSGKIGRKGIGFKAVFAVADAAYKALMQPELGGQEPATGSGSGVGGGKKRNQSIIISGESGAGKTEACRQLMRYIACASSETRRTRSAGGMRAREEIPPRRSVSITAACRTQGELACPDPARALEGTHPSLCSLRGGQPWCVGFAATHLCPLL